MMSHSPGSGALQPASCKKDPGQALPLSSGTAVTPPTHPLHEPRRSWKARGRVGGAGAGVLQGGVVCIPVGRCPSQQPHGYGPVCKSSVNKMAGGPTRSWGFCRLPRVPRTPTAENAGGAACPALPLGCSCTPWGRQSPPGSQPNCCRESGPAR